MNIAGTAVLSPCGTWRLRLDRWCHGGRGSLVFAYFGVNPSTADAEIEDTTSIKWRGFTSLNGGCRYIAGNPFAYRATNVRELTKIDIDRAIGPENDRYLAEIIDEADILVPCWGSRDKLPRCLHWRLDEVMRMLRGSGKPVVTFGLTKSGDPRHPLMLPYSTPLVAL